MWAWILGAAGALLAVPLTVGLVMVLEAFPSSRGFAALLRNKVGAAARDHRLGGRAGTSSGGVSEYGSVSDSSGVFARHPRIQTVRTVDPRSKNRPATMKSGR